MDKIFGSKCGPNTFLGFWGHFHYFNADSYYLFFHCIDTIIGKPNPNSTEESYKTTGIFEGKTLIFENCKTQKV